MLIVDKTLNTEQAINDQTFSKVPEHERQNQKKKKKTKKTFKTPYLMKDNIRYCMHETRPKCYKKDYSQNKKRTFRI